MQDSKHLRAVDTTTGTTLWSKPAPGATGGTMAFGDDTLYATDDSTTLQARDGATGALRWSRDLAGLLPPLKQERRSLFFGMSQPRLSRTAPDVVLVSFWRTQLPAPLPQPTASQPGIVPSAFRARPAMCVTYGCVSDAPQSFITASMDEVTAAVNVRTGAVVWQTDGEFLAQAGQICLVSDEDGTRGVDCGTGTVHWSIDADCDAAVVIDAGSAAVCTAHG
ncbi:outer membrane protein assembly factor BamB family protein, partial [Streptomyces resistomycificus]|uniref:outer membrane protein assembly factor BamB family protein n=1 Tax=Streptomyces resistomycificus TaxID=67356 RepID=UPI001ADF4C4E